MNPAARLSALADRLANAPDLTAAGADVMVRLDYAARWGHDSGLRASMKLPRHPGTPLATEGTLSGLLDDWVPAWVVRTQHLRDAIDEPDGADRLSD